MVPGRRQCRIKLPPCFYQNQKLYSRTLLKWFILYSLCFSVFFFVFSSWNCYVQLLDLLVWSGSFLFCYPLLLGLFVLLPRRSPQLHLRKWALSVHTQIQLACTRMSVSLSSNCQHQQLLAWGLSVVTRFHSTLEGGKLWRGGFILLWSSSQLMTDWLHSLSTAPWRSVELLPTSVVCSFHGWVVLHSTDIPQLLYHPSVKEHWELFIVWDHYE